MRVKHRIRKTERDRISPHKDDPRVAQLLLFLCGSRNCMRCGGLLVTERLDSAGDALIEQQVSSLRCVQCGDIVDRVILHNRMDPAAPSQPRLEEDPWQKQPEDESPTFQEVANA
ncbi:MAG: hypothetical protein KF693_00610 [Nitrospira sp.]|nr:hypothetical protein [Nitrospira sp.]